MMEITAEVFSPDNDNQRLFDLSESFKKYDLGTLNDRKGHVE